MNDLEQRCATANQNIAAALHAYEQAHDLVRENNASLYPTVSIGAAATRNRISETKPLHTPGSPTNYWDFLIPLNISWEPDFWGGIRRQIESSSANAQASAADLANTRLSLQGHAGRHLLPTARPRSAGTTAAVDARRLSSRRCN